MTDNRVRALQKQGYVLDVDSNGYIVKFQGKVLGRADLERRGYTSAERKELDYQKFLETAVSVAQTHKRWFEGMQLVNSKTIEGVR